MSKMTRPQLVVANLLYPAFLGNMVYEAANKLFDTPGSFSWPARFVVLALLVHFVLDWVYTVVEVDPDAAPQGGYKFAQAVCDLFLVLCLYVAVRLALDKPPIVFGGIRPILDPVFWLVVAKVVAVAWEAREIDDWRAPRSWPPLKQLELGLDGGFALLYLLLLWFGPNDMSARNLCFAALIALDCVGYELHARRSRRLATGGQAPAPVEAATSPAPAPESAT
jgi:hypothetical protein